MSLIDWLIVIVPVAAVMYLGLYTRKYIQGVSDFLVSGRLCGRYVLSVAGVAGALAIITLVAYVESHYKTGFALAFWSNLTLPISMLISLTGYCFYRFRETRSMSMGQFLELRYNRKLRIFAAALRSFAEMLANMIMPAIAARFFISFLGLPRHFNLLGWNCPTFAVIVVICLILAISLIYMGGSLAIVVTDTLQGLMCYPLVVTFIIFLLVRFSWGQEIVPVMIDRVPGESFLNPYDIEKLRDFNLFFLCITFLNLGMHTASGVTGTGSSARTAQEQKMANILGTWRSSFSTIFYVVMAIAIITLLQHRNFAPLAKEIRTDISRHVLEEIVPDPEVKAAAMRDIQAIPANDHVIGKDAPFSDKNNPDTPYYEAARKNLSQISRGNALSQEFRTLFQQLMLPVTMRHLLPPGLAGLFCLMIILFMISTDDSRIFSASATLTQDCIVPFYKQISPKTQIKWIRAVSIGVGVFFFFGSLFTAQLDYINLFVTITYGMWLGGCGPVIVLGLYSRFGTTAGAFTSLLSGMGITFGGVMLQRNWAGHIYPWLEQLKMAEPVGTFLTTISKPFNPYIVWEMNPQKFPVNSYEIYFLAMLVSLVLYCLVSWLTCREPFNLDRMLHRGTYAVEGEKNLKSRWTWKSLWGKLIGITPEYSRGDRVIAWGLFFYSFVYQFIFTFLIVVIWNAFSPWPIQWWSRYFLVVMLIVPGFAAATTAVWFGIGGVIDLRRMFRDLRNRTVNPLDNGQVEGHTSLADREAFEKIEGTSGKNK